MEVIILNYENTKIFWDRFNSISNNPETLTLEDRQFLQFWKTELAIAILKDIGIDLGREVANTMIFLCEQC